MKDFKNVKGALKKVNKPGAECVFGIIGFQERLLERLKLNDIPFVEKIGLMKIIKSNITDLVTTKLLDAQLPYIDEVICRISELSYEIDDLFISLNIENVTNDLFNMVTMNTARNQSEHVESLIFNQKTSELIMFDDEGELEFDRSKLKFPNKAFYCRTSATFLNIGTIYETAKRILPLSKYYYPKFEAKYEEHDYLEELKHRDIVIRTPFQSYSMVLDFIDQACVNKDTSAVFISLYRFANNSRIIESLKKAKALGKWIFVYIEKNARGDELHNRDCSIELINAGIPVKVTYGNYKVHAKMFTAIIGDRIYTHLGTGNYNEDTAKIYTDIHLMSSSSSYGCSTLNTFTNIFEVEDKPNILQDERIWFSPQNLKKEILKRIASETAKGSDGYIFLKANSIIDVELIQALNTAALNDVTVNIICRSVCLLKPLLECPNMTVHSYCGRFLEHDRIYIFGAECLIASADLSFRNMHKRIESLIALSPSASQVVANYMTQMVEYHGVIQPYFNKNTDGSWELIKD